jgi:hypothetical protein
MASHLAELMTSQLKQEASQQILISYGIILIFTIHITNYEAEEN